MTSMLSPIEATITEITMSGPGAGGPQTASAVLGDVISAMIPPASTPETSQRLEIADDVESAFYLHLEVADRPGVLAQVAQLLGMQEMLQRSLRGDVEVDMKFEPGLWPVEVDPGELGRTVVIVLHDINFAGHYADRICAVKDGKVVTMGTPEEIMRDEVLSHVFDTDVTVVDGPRGRLAVYY